METINEVKDEIAETETNIVREKENRALSKNINQTRDEIKAIADIWDTCTKAEKKEALRSVIDRIVIRYDHIDVKLKL